MSIEYYSDEHHEESPYTIEDRIHFIEKAGSLLYKAEQLRQKIDPAPIEVRETQITAMAGYPVPSTRCWRATIDAVREFRANRLVAKAQEWWTQV